MLYSRTVLLFLACLLACVSAAPLHRRTCKHASIPEQYQKPPATLPTGDPQAPSKPSPAPSSKPSPQPKPEDKPPKEDEPKDEPEDDPEEDEPEEDEPEDEDEPEEEDEPEPEPGNSGPQTGLMAKLLPADNVLESWSTCSAAKNPLELSDRTLRPHHIMTSLSRNYVNHAGKRAIHAHYRKGSFALGRGNGNGGLSFYAPGPASLELTRAKEAWFGYSVFFPKGFDWALGGKLFGLYGGNSDGEAIGCSGGRRSSACFSARLMWRVNGEGEFYTYLPPYTDSRFSANRKQCTYQNSGCHDTFGASIGRGSFRFQDGAWTTVSQRVRLNDVGRANGELELFVDGKSVINIGGLILRDSNNGRIRGMQAQTFFGGSKPEFQARKNEDAYFADFTMAISEYL